MRQLDVTHGVVQGERRGPEESLYWDTSWCRPVFRALDVRTIPVETGCSFESLAGSGQTLRRVALCTQPRMPVP